MKRKQIKNTQNKKQGWSIIVPEYLLTLAVGKRISDSIPVTKPLLLSKK